MRTEVIAYNSKLN